MSAPDTAYINARIIDPESAYDGPGAVLTKGEEIADLGPDLFKDGVPEGLETVDCSGRVLCPGLIDMRVFIGEPGAEHKETLRSASEAAAAGGITCMAMQPNTDPVIDEVALVEYVKRQARDKAIVRIHPMAAITRNLEGQEMAELGLLADADAVAFTDATRAVADPQMMRRALSYASAFGLLLCQYPEDAALRGEGVMNEGEIAMFLGLAGIPTQAETIVVERDIRLAELTGGRLHFAAVSTGDAIEAIRQAKARGLPISAAAAPHNFGLNETSIGEYRTFAKTAPPLRSEADRAVLEDALADGTIDVICSCHDPQDTESKRLPFEIAATGVIGLETLLPISLELFHNERLSLIDLLAKLTITPAKLLGLHYGRLKAGAPADLLIFDLDIPWRIEESEIRSKSKNSPFEGRPVQGRAWRTVVAGKTVFDAEAS